MSLKRPGLFRGRHFQDVIIILCVRSGAAADGKGHIFVNNERKNKIQVSDIKTWKATAYWALSPCEGPTGIAYDKASDRIFSGCNKTSVVVDPNNGKIVATVKNGTSLQVSR